MQNTVVWSGVRGLEMPAAGGKIKIWGGGGLHQKRGKMPFKLYPFGV